MPAETVTAIAPEGFDAGESGAAVVRYDVANPGAAFAGVSGPVVFVTGAGVDVEGAVAAIRAHGGHVVEVRPEHWDGFEAEAIAGVCLGVIAGFGANGVREAVRFLGAPVDR